MLDGSVLGLIVAGGPSPLAGLGVDDAAALTPFGGKYRFIGLAFATLANSGVGRGAVVEDGEMIGYEHPAAPARPLPSGLTLVPAAQPAARAVG
jgi:hypothetical protein